MCGIVMLALLAASPVEIVAKERVDLIEINNFYDDQGRLVFTQQIFYDWEPNRERFNVRAWRLVKDANQVPERDWQRGGYVTRWQDGEITREIRASHYRQSWTQYDPELCEREALCKDKRRELSHPTAARPR